MSLIADKKITRNIEKAKEVLPEGFYHLKFMEELGELQKEIAKHLASRLWGDKVHSERKIKEEIADVLLTLVIYLKENELDFDELEQIIEYKADRGYMEMKQRRRYHEPKTEESCEEYESCPDI